jgi:hypothetical protein
MSGERPLVGGLREITRQMNDKVQYCGCTPYSGIKHSLPPDA